MQLADKNKEDVKWIVYAKPGVNLEPLQQLLRFEVRRFAFADQVKINTHEMLQMAGCPPHAFELLKDNRMLVASPHEPGIFKSMRTWYIEVGMQGRQANPFCWTRLTHDAMDRERAATSRPFIAILSDWRFQNELLNPECITIRLHRKDVAFPAAAELCEHELDDWMTDFLLIPPGAAEWQIVCLRFPQCIHYKPQASLC